MSQVGLILMIMGAFLTFLAGYGLVRLPSGLSRIHAAAKPASLGLTLVAVGAGVTSGSWGLAATGLLIAVLQFLTAPIAGHLLGRTLIEESEALVDDSAEPPERTGSKWRQALVIETVVVWLILWRDISIANFVAGVALGVLVTILAPPRSGSYPRPLGAASALARYVVSLVSANARMVYQVLFVGDEDLQETLVVCDLETREETVAFFDANATSFSPGTLTLEITADAPYRMVVHGIGQTSDEVREGIADLEKSASRMVR